jgi:ribose-phosphate pyrophosphokinase
MNDLKIFSGRVNPSLTADICNYLHIQQGKVDLGNFPDGEISCKINEDIRGRDVFLVMPTCPPVNDNLMELMILIDCCRRASAERITAVLPYFGYARQDRKDSGRVPITAKLCADLITRAGADRCLAMDLHTAQIQGFFDVPVDHLYAAPVLDTYFLDLGFDADELVVVSPDEGSIKKALKHQAVLKAGLAIVDKRRTSAEETKQENIIGVPVEGKICIIFDDMISTGGSICGAAEVIKQKGAKEIYVAASHGVFCGNAIEKLKNAPIKEVVVTNSIPLSEEARKTDLFKQLSVAPLLGEAIKRIHRNESVSYLFDHSVDEKQG